MLVDCYGRVDAHPVRGLQSEDWVGADPRKNHLIAFTASALMTP